VSLFKARIDPKLVTRDDFGQNYSSWINWCWCTAYNIYVENLKRSIFCSFLMLKELRAKRLILSEFSNSPLHYLH